ncbi:putative killer toxin subunits alpha/beta [Amylocarpus encephaloides]|uniref:Killer toxin subunits alpha/beta n=1 Tax=Amylocarpus encephaloides TaxID=45428 RepID=A0A9P7YFR6_9HELO|nr:putative killer toxin subunits alpha/beta [Amylocarpus encephaloides]
MRSAGSILAILALASTSFAHMEMSFPPPLRGKTNPNAKEGTKDFSMTTPLADKLCKGYETDMADTTGAGSPTATFAKGAKANMTIVGGAVHGGGSCQASLSYDQGKTFTVIHSYIGSCPLKSGDNFDFTIPSDAKEGIALFSWSWVNQIGNREFYQNCASVNIAAGSGPAPSVAFDKRPQMFVANLAGINDCKTVESKDTVFPDPGPDVTEKVIAKDNTNTVTGNCGAAGAAPAGGAPPAGGDSPAAPADGGKAPESSAAAPAPTSAAPSSAAAAAPTITIIPSQAPSSAAGGGASPTSSASSPPASSGAAGAATTNGQCGATSGSSCAGSSFGQCCSSFGFCGVTETHCGVGCQAGFGTCGSAKRSFIVSYV